MAKKNLWHRWKRLAHRAAEIQAIVILTIVYWVIVVPIAFLQRLGGRRTIEPGWQTRPPTGPVPIENARRQS
jgi:hypothetical protein